MRISEYERIVEDTTDILIGLMAVAKVPPHSAKKIMNTALSGMSAVKYHYDRLENQRRIDEILKRDFGGDSDED